MTDILRHTPKPLVEEHYHINELINAQQQRAEARTKWQNQKQAIDAFLKYVQDFKDVETLDFFCTHCQRDFIARAHKQVDSWGELAYYKIKHRCGTWSIRHITDRERDGYFFRSRQVAYDRGINSLNALQEFETGYNMVYGKK